MLKKHDPTQQRVVVRVRDASVDVDALARAHDMVNLGEMLTLPLHFVLETLPTRKRDAPHDALAAQVEWYLFFFFSFSTELTLHLHF